MLCVGRGMDGNGTELVLVLYLFAQLDDDAQLVVPVT